MTTVEILSPSMRRPLYNAFGHTYNLHQEKMKSLIIHKCEKLIEVGDLQDSGGDKGLWNW